MEFTENEIISSVDELSSNVDELCSKVPIIFCYCKALMEMGNEDILKSHCYCCRSHYYPRWTFQLRVSPSGGSDGFVELFSPWNQLLYQAAVQGIQEFGSWQFHCAGVYYQRPGLRCSWKVHHDRKGETFTANELSFNLNLGHCR